MLIEKKENNFFLAFSLMQQNQKFMEQNLHLFLNFLLNEWADKSNYHVCPRAKFDICFRTWHNCVSSTLEDKEKASNQRKQKTAK